MPFTPAHAVVTLPFIRINPAYISATGLIIGSMAPDLEYFIRMSNNDHHGHTWLGSLYFDIPITIISAFIFHLIVKKNFINNMPLFLQQRFQPLLRLDFLQHFKKHYPAFIVSAWVGTLSHFMLDSFTHQTGFFARHLHYDNVIVMYHSQGYPMWEILQLGLSAVGCFIIAVYILMMKAYPLGADYHTPTVRYWLAFSAVAILTIFCHYAVIRRHLGIAHFVISCMTGLLVAMIVCGLIKFDNATRPLASSR